MEKKGFYSVILNEVKNLDIGNLRSFVPQVDKTFYRHHAWVFHYCEPPLYEWQQLLNHNKP